MSTFAARVIKLNNDLEFKGTLPEGIRIMNPFKENPEIPSASSLFYKKFYNDNEQRNIIMGINPGRFGGGATGIPFTDSKRLINECKIPYPGKLTHEPSSAFVYDIIQAYGGVEAFYKKFYITSLCPLGFTKINGQEKEVNYNYYDSKQLTDAVYDFILESMNKQLALGINTKICYCFGTGKNEKFLRKLNEENKYFKQIIPLEHPRFVVQYKHKVKEFYINKFLKEFERAG